MKQIISNEGMTQVAAKAMISKYNNMAAQELAEAYANEGLSMPDYWMGGSDDDFMDNIYAKVSGLDAMDVATMGIDYDYIWTTACEINSDMMDDVAFEEAQEETGVYEAAEELNKALSTPYGEYNTMMMWKQHHPQIASEMDNESLINVIRHIDDFGYAYNNTYKVCSEKMGCEISKEDGFNIALPDGCWWYDDRCEGVDVVLDWLGDIREWCWELVMDNNNVAVAE